MTRTTAEAAVLIRIRDEIRRRQRFLVTSHARPDGDSIGSQVALALALEALAKSARIINRDPPPDPYRAFPGVDRIEVAETVDGPFDAVIVLECGDLERPGVTGLEPYFVINIDHHVGNTGYGALNWFDPTAAACGELVFELIEALGVPLSVEMATHVYMAILADTGSFRHSNISARTFDVCRRAADAGLDAAAVARQVFDSSSVSKLKLMGALLDTMQIEDNGRLAVLYLDRQILERAGCAPDETEGLINVPLSAREIQAVLLFRVERPGQVRVSARSKGHIDVRALAARHGGGGHPNAAGFTVGGLYEHVRRDIVAEARALIAAGLQPRGGTA